LTPEVSRGWGAFICPASPALRILLETQTISENKKPSLSWMEIVSMNVRIRKNGIRTSPFIIVQQGFAVNNFFGIKPSLEPTGVPEGFSFLILRRVDFFCWNPFLLLSGCGILDHAGGLPPQKDLHDLCRRRRDEHEGQHHQPVARAQGNRVHEGLQERKVDGCQQKQEG
jgi:hypothetical protein